MDPLSAVASVAAVIDLSAKILLACYRLHGQIKSAQSDIGQIIIELESLSAVLQDVHDILDSKTVQSAAAISSLSIGDPRGPLASARLVLESLSAKIGPLAKPGLKTALIWPLESKTVQQKMDALQNAKATLQLALSSLQTVMLADQVEKLNLVQGGQSQSLREAVLKWYKTSDPETNHRLSKEKREPGTATWVFENETFLGWYGSPGSVLWLHGIPGAGKTILCSAMIDYLQTECGGPGGGSVLYFYFDFADGRKQSAHSFIKSLVYQVLSTEDAIAEPAMDLYRARNSGTEEADVDELFYVFVDLLSAPETTYVCVDALDECTELERRRILQLVGDMSSAKNVSVSITSRREVDVEDALARMPTCRAIQIESAAVDADVRTYASNVIAQDLKLSKWRPNIRHEMLDAVVEGSHGM